MKLISYAQNFEDIILWRALKDVDGGFYIDIGAQDPKDDSVSALFYEKGWRGVHVEPNDNYATLLRAARPDEDVVQAVVGSQDGEIEFYEFGTTGLNTGNREIADYHVAQGLAVSSQILPSIRLSTLLERYSDRTVHWLKIDVEGMEGEVIRHWQPARVRPWILVIESTLPNSPVQNHEGWEPDIVALGYRFAYFDGLNRFYVHETQLDRLHHFGPGPNVFDDFILERSLQYYHRAALAVRQSDETVAELGESQSHLATVQNDLEARLKELASRDELLAASRLDISRLESLLASEAADKARLNHTIEEMRSAVSRLEAMLARSDDMLQRRDAMLLDVMDQKSAIEEPGPEAGRPNTRSTQEIGRLKSDVWQLESSLAQLTAESQNRIEASAAAVLDAESRLNAVYTSTSWRVTRPLRGVKHLLAGGRSGRRSVVSSLMRSVLERLLRILRRHPRLRARLWQLIQRSPTVERRALAFALARPRQPGTEAMPFGADWMLDPEPHSLATWKSLMNSPDRKV